LIVTFRHAALGAPPIGSAALNTAAGARTLGRAIRLRLAAIVPAGAAVAGVSPTILAARIRVADATQRDAIAAALGKDPGIASVAPNQLIWRDETPLFPYRTSSAGGGTAMTPNNPLYPFQSWHYGLVDLPRAWAMTTGNRAVLVAVVDDGIRFDHPAIRGNLTTDGYDFVNSADSLTLCAGGRISNADDGNGYDPDPTDPASYSLDSTGTCFLPDTLGNHGLHVAGTIGAVGNNGIGVAGVNWAVQIRPVRVLGVDDFSLRRGHTYATLLVDMESGVPADVLPDREAATLKTWLEAHPGVEVICRDRAGAYAEGARDGAPDADQVADRWHLWHNVCEHARKAVARHQDCIKDPARPCRHPQQQEKDREQEEERQEQEQEEECVPGPEDAIAARHRAVHGLRAAGRTLAETAAELGLSDQVTGRFWRAASASALLARRTPALDPWKPYLRQRWDQGATKITDLHREITARGFTGSYSITYAWLAMLRLAALPRPPAPPKPRLVTRWLLTDPARLDPAGAAALAAITAHCPDLAGLAGHVTEFAKILTGRHGSRLDAWLDAVTADPAQPDLHSFANGIRHDYQAVRNGLTLQWNSGRVEGLNTRTKLIKRQMYGRATFPLLRKRILLTS